MGYALFASEKLTLTGRINLVQNQQMHRSDEQAALAVKNTDIEHRITELNLRYSEIKSDLYEQKNALNRNDFITAYYENSITEDDIKQYIDTAYKNADGSLNRTKEGYEAAEAKAKYDAAMAKYNAADSTAKADAREGYDKAYAELDLEIQQEENKKEKEISSLKSQIYSITTKENAIEMEVKRLDTTISAMTKQLDKIIEAEKTGIEKAVPSFNGQG